MEYQLKMIAWLDARLEKCLPMDILIRDELIKQNRELKAELAAALEQEH